MDIGKSVLPYVSNCCLSFLTSYLFRLYLYSLVPKRYDPDVKLGTWVHTQRIQYRKLVAGAAKKEHRWRSQKEKRPRRRRKRRTFGSLRIVGDVSRKWDLSGLLAKTTRLQSR